MRVDIQTKVDLLVVGSGGGGLTAALTAAAAGARVLVIEKQPTLGGTTAYSGGAVWIPNNPLMREAGRQDSDAEAWQYLDGLVGNPGPGGSEARKRAFLDAGPAMIAFLCRQGLRFACCANFPDYYAGRPGGKFGRTIEPAMFDGRKLGGQLMLLNQRPIMPGVAMRTADLSGLFNGVRDWAAVRTLLGIVWRTSRMKLSGRVPLTMGMALIGQLLHACRSRGVEVLTQAKLRQLKTDAQGRVTGALIDLGGETFEVDARCGVLLASGGFAHNRDMRAVHQPLASPAWTSAPRGDEGDGIRAGLAVGAATSLLDEGWWMPTSVLPNGECVACVAERCKPFSIIVDAAGQRFCNEAGSYMEVGQRIQRRHAERGGTIPCWLIFDARHRRYYPFGKWLPGFTPRNALESGYIVRAPTLDTLAHRCGIDVAGLGTTVERFNRMALAGKDEDFYRGDDPYDRHYGDSRVKPNPSLGPLEQAPFYAVRLYPGDIGTNGGLLTDEHARVVGESGVPIEGLYATGNCTASVMGRAYPGAGATIAPSMTFGFIAARHVTGEAGF